MAWRRDAETVIDLATFGMLVVPLVAVGLVASMAGAAGMVVASVATGSNPYAASD